ncbi:hypothetical protein RhiirA4_452932 [Rhizophagus irregularis]|uniref:Uncharacterized protein n=1 Tax=Rhizophagus irregularis TaxID=588596 RepID=A0A2I1FZC2_9GLOM|nr:hypothetical protein RhiirA4_452932 [Rhizophagus irregularis]
MRGNVEFGIRYQGYFSMIVVFKAWWTKCNPQYLSLLTRIALRQESERLDAGNNYAIGETDSEGSDPSSD